MQLFRCMKNIKTTSIADVARALGYNNSNNNLLLLPLLSHPCYCFSCSFYYCFVYLVVVAAVNAAVSLVVSAVVL